MGAEIECFFLEPIPFAQEALRRYSSATACPAPAGYHTISVVLGTVPYDGPGRGADDFPHDDPRWPKQCSCGYVFLDTDHWQHNLTQLMRRGDHATMTTTIEEAPPGAMWFAPWFPWKGPDGQCLVVKTPAGDWIVDGPKPWTRTGTVPKVTAQPSILFTDPEHGYHGFLIDGVLREC